MGFKKAVKEKLWLRVLIGGSSGSGKTYSALRLATGIAKSCGSRVAAIDTENDRMNYYADEFDFDRMKLEAPFKPQKYIDAINEAISAGYKVLIIDSTSHEWKWCYDTVTAMSGNSFQNWGKIKAQYHQKFAEAIIQSPIHIICTARGKDEYTMDEKDGKKTPKKVGVGIQQEDNTEYDYTVTFNLAQDTHIFSTMKDNTHLFEDRYEVLTEKDGELLYKWANSGVEKVKPVTNPVVNEDEDKSDDDDNDIIALEEKVAALIQKKTELGVGKDAISAALKSACGKANYRKYADVNLLNKAIDAINGLTVEAKENKEEEVEQYE